MSEPKNYSLHSPIRFSFEQYEDMLDCYDEESNFSVQDLADELVFKSAQDQALVDFNVWSRLEDLMGERLSFDEFCYLDQAFHCDLLEIDKKDLAIIKRLRTMLSDYRKLCT